MSAVRRKRTATEEKTACSSRGEPRGNPAKILKDAFCQDTDEGTSGEEIRTRSIRSASPTFNFARFAYQDPRKNASAKVNERPIKAENPAAGPRVPQSDAMPLPGGSGAIIKKKIIRSPRKTIESLQTVRLPDYLRPGLDMMIVGFNPGCNSASHGHHYAGPGNHFWKCLSASGLVSEPLKFVDDVRIMEFGIGLTNIVARPSTGSSDLSKLELQAGVLELKRKIAQYQPKIVVFNGLGIYEAFSGSKNFRLGKQPECLKGNDGEDIFLFVMPSSSPRGSKWPKMEDKLKFYSGLSHLRDFVQGKVTVLDVEKVTFPK